MSRWLQVRGAGWIVIGVVVSLVMGCWGCAVNPVTGEQELAFMSERQELALGAKFFPRTIQLMDGLPAKDPGLQAYAQSVGLKLAAVSHRPKLPWEFKVVNTSDVNASALPGGKIFITRGLITRLTNEDQLAFIFGHEIGHVAARHHVAMYTRKVLASVALVALAVAISDQRWAQPLLLGAGLAGTLLLLSFSRDQERQADELGYIYMTKCGYHPKGMVGAFLILQQVAHEDQSLVTLLFRTHPYLSERLEVARQRTKYAPITLGFKTKAFDKALALQRDRAPAYAAMDKGSKLAKQSLYYDALQQYKKAISLFPDEGIFHVRLSTLFLRIGEPRKALKEATIASRLAPRVFSPHLAAGLACLRMNRVFEALVWLKKADELLPEYQPTKWAIACAYDRLGVKDRAIDYYQQTVNIAPRTKLGRAAAARITLLRWGL